MLRFNLRRQLSEAISPEGSCEGCASSKHRVNWPKWLSTETVCRPHRRIDAASGQRRPSLRASGSLSHRELLIGYRALLVEERGRIERRFRTLRRGSVVDLATHRRALSSLATAEADLAGRALAVASAERDGPV